MRSSEVAGRAGVNVQNPRHYERRGWLDKPPRTPSLYREHPAYEMAVVRFVKRVQEHEFRLDDVEQLLHLADGVPRMARSPAKLARVNAGPAG
ncbi:MerR family transcriptional regulator [Mycolicibacterium gadium]|uniref:MerR family transcriptional regulator n=1 Tax=Mycolicibacterium gadium TaxID=1794 RepID=A0ABT6GZP2_MYCGU|nr:MerR family transcriptional regulator [Mycolicibacterium gadium]MDG5486971.1 MerR family transcriptional regulator [Mycolicibacterium gadium]